MRIIVHEKSEDGHFFALDGFIKNLVPIDFSGEFVQWHFNIQYCFLGGEIERSRKLIRLHDFPSV